MKLFGRIALIAGIVIAVLLIAAGIGLWVIISFATTDNMADKYTLTEREDGFVDTVFKGAVFGDEFTLSEAMVNTFVNDKYCTPFSETGSGIENIRMYFHSGSETEIYSRIYHRGREYAIAAKAEVISAGSGGRFDIILRNVRIGKLDISEDMLSFILPRLIDDTKLYTVTENRISVTAYYEYEIKNTSIEMYLDSFSSQEGAVLCRTNDLSKEALRAAKEYLLSDEFKEDIGEAFDRIKGKLGEIFS